MKKKSIFKRLSSLLIVMLMAVSVFQMDLLPLQKMAKTQNTFCTAGATISVIRDLPMLMTHSQEERLTMPLITNGRRSFSIGQTAAETIATAYS